MYIKYKIYVYKEGKHVGFVESFNQDDRTYSVVEAEESAQTFETFGAACAALGAVKSLACKTKLKHTFSLNL